MAKVDFLTEILQPYKQIYIYASYWIGLSDETVEGEWVWVYSNQVATYTSWGSGKPSNYNSAHDFVALYKVDNFMWTDSGPWIIPQALCQKNQVHRYFHQSRNVTSHDASSFESQHTRFKK